MVDELQALIATCGQARTAPATLQQQSDAYQQRVALEHSVDPERVQLQAVNETCIVPIIDVESEVDNG